LDFFKSLSLFSGGADGDAAFCRACSGFQIDANAKFLSIMHSPGGRKTQARDAEKYLLVNQERLMQPKD
jgi:hypothetical protein